MNANPEPNWRKPVGMLAILAYVAVWIVLVASFSQEIAGMPWPLQAVVYLIAGIVWIMPLKPALIWMETGRWRA